MSIWIPEYFMALLQREGLIPKAIEQQMTSNPQIRGDLECKVAKSVNVKRLLELGVSVSEIYYLTACKPWHKCSKCGHVWAARKSAPPARCPNHDCRSTLWL